MSYGNRFAQLTTEAAENAAHLVLTQLSERLNFSKGQSESDEEMECLQFGFCSKPETSTRSLKEIPYFHF